MDGCAKKVYPFSLERTTGSAQVDQQTICQNVS